KPYQVDLAFYYIKLLSLIGAVSSYRDSKKEFYADHCKVIVDDKNEFVVPKESVLLVE
ncbi:MAG: fatty acid desaturase, partial [Mucilaginibacter sp.]|nr:fatty acid desaturase [Mucilaginibacter sp.]